MSEELDFNAISVSVPGAVISIPSTGGNVNIDRSIQNATTSTAGNCKYRIYLSSDTVIDAGDYEIYSDSVLIQGNSTDTRTDNCTVGGAVPTGFYYVGLYITRDFTTQTVRTAGQDVEKLPFPPEFNAVSISVPGAVVHIPDTGGNFDATRSINNTSTTGTCNYRIYLSTDTTIDTGDYEVYSNSVVVNNGTTDTDTVTCNVGGAVPTGTYYVGLYLLNDFNTQTCRTAAQDVEKDPPPPVFNAVSVSVPGAVIHIPYVGGNFNVSRSISNASTTGTSNYRIYLSVDTTIDVTDYEVLSDSVLVNNGTTDTNTVICFAGGAVPTGTYYVGLYLLNDYNTQTCNTAAQDVEKDPPPEFNAVSVSVPGAIVHVPDSGGNIDVSRSINNTSTTDTCNYRIYLSTDNIIDAGDYLIYSNSVIINNGTTDTNTDTCAVAGGVPAGMYYAGLYIVDNFNTQTACTAAQDVEKDPPPPFNAAAVAVPRAAVLNLTT